MKRSLDDLMEQYGIDVKPVVWPKWFMLTIAIGLFALIVWITFVPGCRLLELKLPPASPIPTPDQQPAAATPVTPEWIMLLGSSLGTAVAVIGHRYWYHGKQNKHGKN